MYVKFTIHQSKKFSVIKKAEHFKEKLSTLKAEHLKAVACPTGKS